MKNKEIWKDIVGYEGLYQVSNLGRVKSLHRNGTNGGIRKLSNISGYLRVALKKQGVSFNAGVHRLVAQAFIPNTNNKPTVNHIDGNKHNNNVDNLEWADYKEQLEHSLKTGLRKHQCNIQHKCKLLTPQFVKEFETFKDLSSYLGYTRGFVTKHIRTNGSRFYLYDKLIVIEDDPYYDNVKYIPPTANDIPLSYYCKLNNINYRTVKDRLHRGWTLETAVKNVPSHYTGS